MARPAASARNYASTIARASPAKPVARASGKSCRGNARLISVRSASGKRQLQVRRKPRPDTDSIDLALHGTARVRCRLHLTAGLVPGDHIHVAVGALVAIELVAALLEARDFLRRERAVL